MYMNYELSIKIYFYIHVYYFHSQRSGNSYKKGDIFLFEQDEKRIPVLK